MGVEATQKTTAAVVVNDLGSILAYTARATREQCEEEAVRLWGEHPWAQLRAKGARIVSCEIVLLEDRVSCPHCDTDAFLTTTVEEQDVLYGPSGKSFAASFPVHHCSQCGESFLGDTGMKARDAAQRAFEGARRAWKRAG